MSYGPASLENHAGAARYVDRILKGARIRELPFEEPTEFKLAINLRTAQAMKLKIPPNPARPRRRGGRVMVCVRPVKGLR